MRTITPRNVTWLIAAIAVVDVVVRAVAPSHTGLVIKAVSVGGFVLWARAWAGMSWAELGLSRSALPSGVRVGCVAALIVALAIVVLVALPMSRSYFSESVVTAASTTTRVLEPLLIIPLGTVLFEETIFRGVLLGALLRLGSRRRAALTSSVVFGLWHLPPALAHAGGKSPQAAVAAVVGTIAVTTVAGLLFAFLRLQSGSLLAPIFGHIATNSFSYIGAIVALQL